MTSKRETLVPFKNHAYSGLGSSFWDLKNGPKLIILHIKSLSCVCWTQCNR